MQDINNKNLQKFGKAIKTIRRQRKWSLSKLSHRAGFSPSTLKRIESGDSEPKYLTILKLADAFELSLFEFFRIIDKLLN